MTRILKLALVLAVAVTLSTCGAGPGGKQTKAPAASQ